MHEGVFNVHSSQHLWVWDNSYAISKRVYQVPFSVSVWARIVLDIVMGPCLLPDRLTAQQYRNLLETALMGLHEEVSLAVRQSLWFQHDIAPVRYEEGVQEWLNVTYPGTWIGH
jgi:hypothetical protein